MLIGTVNENDKQFHPIIIGGKCRMPAVERWEAVKNDKRRGKAYFSALPENAQNKYKSEILKLEYSYVKVFDQWERDNISDSDYAKLQDYLPTEYFLNIIAMYLCTRYYHIFEKTLKEIQSGKFDISAADKKYFSNYFNLCYKPAVDDFVVKCNSLRKQAEIYADIHNFMDNAFEGSTEDIQKVNLNKLAPDKLKNLLYELNEGMQLFFECINNTHAMHDDLSCIFEEYAITLENYIANKGKNETTEYNADLGYNTGYSRVFSNNFASSVMNMYTSSEIKDDKSLLSNAEKRYNPQRRGSGSGAVNEIIVHAIENDCFMANWGTTEKRLFALYNEFICKSGSNRNSPFVMRLDDFMKKCDLSASNKKDTRKSVKNSLITMGSTSIITQIGVVNLFQSATISNGIIRIMGTDDLVENLAERNQSMFLPPEYFTCKGKNAVSAMNVIQTLCYNYGNYNNVNASEVHKNHRNEKITVKSLLSHTDIITIEEVRKQETAWKQKIKSPLEKLLDNFPGPDCWGYLDNKGNKILPERLPSDISYEEWEHLVIQYFIESFPIDTIKQAIATKKEKFDESRAILSDKAAIARDRSERRQEKKNKEETTD